MYYIALICQIESNGLKTYEVTCPDFPTYKDEFLVGETFGKLVEFIEESFNDFMKESSVGLVKPSRMEEIDFDKTKNFTPIMVKYKKKY